VAVTAPIWARTSDRRGRKPLIQLGLLGFGVSMASFAMVVQAGLNDGSARARCSPG
jgi:MFS family permease